MISSVELFVGLRYLRAKRRTRFVSFITLISLLGIALGVAVILAAWAIILIYVWWANTHYDHRVASIRRGRVR